MLRLTRRPKVVFFDYGDTLIRGEPPYLHRIAHALQWGGFSVPEEAAELAGHAADYDCYEAWRAGQLDLDDAALPVFVQNLLRHLELPPLLLAERPDILQRFFVLNRERELTMFPGVVDLLETLRSRGYRLGIISNNDGTCARKCAQAGIADFFEVIIDSSVEQVRKPDGEIFRRACLAMGVEPTEAVHVGDMFGADVCGGSDAGLATIWLNFRGIPAPAPERTHLEIATIGIVADCLP